jgi:hypothetical protein
MAEVRMTWAPLIKAIDIEKLDSVRTDDWLDENEAFSTGTVLLKKKGKVVAVCSLELLDRSGVVMCAYEEFRYGLTLRKIRRPKTFDRYMGKNVTVGETLKEFIDTAFI